MITSEYIKYNESKYNSFVFKTLLRYQSLKERFCKKQNKTMAY